MADLWTERMSRRHLLRWSALGIGASALLTACGGTVSTATTAPTARPSAAPSAASGGGTTASAAPSQPATSATPLAGAGIGGAQPTAIATTTGTLKNPVAFVAPKTKATGPTQLTFWHYAGFHVNVQKFIAEEYKKQHDQNVTLEITAYPGLNEQRTAIKAALAAGSAALMAVRCSLRPG